MPCQAFSRKFPMSVIDFQRVAKPLWPASITGISLPSGLTKSRGFAWPQVLCTGPVGIFLVVSRFDAFERKCDKSLGVEVQIVRQPARRADGLAIPRPNGLRFADRRHRL